MPAADLRSDERKEIDASIDRAISRERERCARIAEKWPSTFSGPVSTQGQYAAENIAAAIRRIHGE